MFRSATSQSCRDRIKTPLHIEEIENRKRMLLSRNISRNNQKTPSYFKQVSTPFRQTGATLTRPHIAHRIRSSSQSKTNNSYIKQDIIIQSNIRPNSIDQRKNHKIPLKLLKMMRISESNQKNYAFNSERTFQERKKIFLRKGTAINRAIMFNVLKSKCNKNINDSSSSYINNNNNAGLGAAIYDQVPKGLRDVIGPQEMLRMSNIFTGGTISAINLHKKVSDIINRYHEHNKIQGHQEDEGMTLKSIKRW